jgi:very-short-patch-repair endonuclease
MKNDDPRIKRFILCIKALKLPDPEREYKFCDDRRWRFDFAWVDKRLALEIEGGVWLSKFGKKSRHFYGAGAIADMEKYNFAAELGWRVLRYTPDKIDYNQISRVLTEKLTFTDLCNCF